MESGAMEGKPLDRVRREHIAPKFDINGKEVIQYSRPMTTDPQWPSQFRKDKKPNYNTRGELLFARKDDFNADPSYNLSIAPEMGGKNVTQRDYFLAKRFDEGNKGKLTDAEREKAREAISQGYDKNFRFGLEQTGARPHHRVLQIKGKVIEGEDFSAFTDSYDWPEWTQNVPKYGTTHEYHDKRRQEGTAHEEENHHTWMAANARTRLSTRDSDRTMEITPYFKTANEDLLPPKPELIKGSQRLRQEERRQALRDAAGLGLPRPSTVDDNKTFSLSVQKELGVKPTTASHAQMIRQRRTDRMTGAIEQLRKNYNDYVPRAERRERELNKLVATIGREKSKKTRSELLSTRSRTFVEQAEAIRQAKENQVEAENAKFPKFGGRDRPYWEYSPRHTVQPTQVSQSIQYATLHKKPNPYNLSDPIARRLTPEEKLKSDKAAAKHVQGAGQSSDRRYYRSQKFTSAMTAKSTKSWEQRDPDYVRPEVSSPYHNESAPMYSSFGKHNVYNPRALQKAPPFKSSRRSSEAQNVYVRRVSSGQGGAIPRAPVRAPSLNRGGIEHIPIPRGGEAARAARPRSRSESVPSVPGRSSRASNATPLPTIEEGAKLSKSSSQPAQIAGIRASLSRGSLLNPQQRNLTGSASSKVLAVSRRGKRRMVDVFAHPLLRNRRVNLPRPTTVAAVRTGPFERVK